MKRFSQAKNRSNRRLKQTRKLFLENLEDRTLLDATAVIHHPEAVLRPSFNVGTVGKGANTSPFMGPLQEPPGSTPPNVLVNDPAEDNTPPTNQDTHSETSLVLDGNTILASFNDSHLYNGGSLLHFTGFARSTDGGSTFQDLGALPNISGGDCGDPVMARDNVTGRVYFATLSCSQPTIPLFRSDDDFQTFLPTVNSAPGHSGLQDKEWMTVDNFAGPGQGTVYVVVRDFGAGNGIYLSRSTDHGDTFGPNGGVQIVSGGGGNVQGAWVTVGPDHTVYASWYDATTTPNSIKIRSSTDGGVTFGSPHTITTLQTNGTNGDLGLGGFRSNAFTQVAVNPATGQLYAAYDDKGIGSDRADVFLRTSEDGGVSWDPAIRVVDDTTGHDQWQPALAVSPDGSKVGVYWYDRRNDPGNNLIDRYGAIGVVSGSDVLFGPNFRISDTSFPTAFGHDPVVNGIYMGDYDQVVADPTGFYGTWGDNRLPSIGHTGNKSDVRFAKTIVSVSGPAVVSISPRGNTLAPVSTFRVSFDEQIDPTTATPDQFVVTDPNGNPVNVQSVTPVNSNDIQFDVVIDTQTQGGTYNVTVGPFIADVNGNFMDQDGDGDNADGPEDAFNGSFSIVGPSVTSTTISGRIADNVSGGQIVFNTPIDPNSFTPDQLVITGPGGVTATNITITPDDGTNTVFDITFDQLSTLGNYTVSIGPNITDAFGNPMANAYSGTFVLTSERIVNGGFETGSFMGWTTMPAPSGSLFGVGGNAHTGQFAAYFGGVVEDSFDEIWQDVPTTAGAMYTIDFWLMDAGGGPSEFKATWGNTTLTDMEDPAPFGYTHLTFTQMATGPTMRLLFASYQVPSYFYLDDVSVNPTGSPAPGGHFGPAGDAALGTALTADHVTQAQPNLVSDGHLTPVVAPVAAPSAPVIPPQTTAKPVDSTVAPAALLHQSMVTSTSEVLDPLASDRYIV